ncbi:hypothetical protein ACFYWX_39600 [Streptomyces sp. NPDC002888]|uniref:hypothetical protein n=1 Tax=Streptomyces sp. NPDC002888 TaxID=3364668 RepID=UPI003688BAE3
MRITGHTGNWKHGSAVVRRSHGLLPVLPMDLAPTIRMVQAQDVAEATAAVLHQRADDPFGTATDTSVTAAVIADVAGGRIRHRPVEVRRCP